MIDNEKVNKAFAVPFDTFVMCDVNKDSTNNLYLTFRHFSADIRKPKSSLSLFEYVDGIQTWPLQTKYIFSLDIKRFHLKLLLIPYLELTLLPTISFTLKSNRFENANISQDPNIFEMRQSKIANEIIS